MDKPRYLFAQVVEDLAIKMVLVRGPRQVGKTTLAKHILSPLKRDLNWEISLHRIVN